MFDFWSTQDLVQLAVNGGGFELNAGTRSLQDRLMIAANAKVGGAKIVLRGMSTWPPQQLIQIAANGKGHVTFVG
jgi:hypothetical protein